MKLLKRTWADVSLDALAHNYRAIRGHIPAGCKFLGVMKADAYGHGAVPMSHALVELGAEYLAVSNLEEAVQIRRGGIRAPILILGYTPAMYAENMIYLDLTQEVHSLDYAQALNEALSGTNFILNVHLKLDTGMTRIGFTAYGDEAAMQDLAAAARLPHLHVEGAFMHFSVADSRARRTRPIRASSTGVSKRLWTFWRARGSSRSCVTAAIPGPRCSTRSTPWIWCGRAL